MTGRFAYFLGYFHTGCGAEEAARVQESRVGVRRCSFLEDAALTLHESIHLSRFGGLAEAGRAGIIMNTHCLGSTHLKGALKRAQTHGSTVRDYIMEEIK